MVMAETFNVDTGGTDGAATSKPVETPRRRGRPFGSRSREPLQEQSAPTPGSAGSAQGSENKPRKRRAKPVDLDELAKKIQGIHGMIALMTGLPEVAVSDMESKMLATAMSDMSREYGLEVSGKTAATIQLVGTAAIIYMPRVGAIKAKIDAAKRKHAQSQPIEGEVVHPNGTAAAP